MKKVERVNRISFPGTSGLPDATHYQDKLLIADLVKESSPESATASMPMRCEDYYIILVEQGEMKIEIDYIPYAIGAHTFLFIKERNVTRILSLSADCKGYRMMARSSFLRTLTKEAKPPRGVNTLLNPVTVLEADQFQLIKAHLERLRRAIDRKEHLFHAKLVENEFVNFILELWNFRVVRAGIQQLPVQKPGNREHIAAEFLRLLCIHIHTEREVAFYANLLCVTPIYLSRTVKQVLGVPPIKVINDLTLSDALSLLRKREMTIGQVADELNFPEPASFSKFF